MRFAMAISLVLSGCGSRAENSGVTSIIGAPQFTVMKASAIAQDPAARAMGALMVVLPDPEQAGVTFALPFCSGFQVAPHYIVTAAHCDRTQYAFNTHRVAQDTDISNYSFDRVGSSERMIFHGDMVAESAPAERDAASYAVAYKNPTMDFMIYHFEKEQSGISVKLPSVAAAAPSRSFDHLALYGYPNGMPLTVASSCGGTVDTDGLHMRHDCDSLSGASGGLIADAEGHPVAIQLTGPAQNSADHFEQTGSFESAEEFAVQRGCVRGQADFPACVLARGMNGALMISALTKDVQDKAPEVWKAISDDTPSCQSDTTGRSTPSC